MLLRSSSGVCETWWDAIPQLVFSDRDENLYLSVCLQGMCTGYLRSVQMNERRRKILLEELTATSPDKSRDKRYQSTCIETLLDILRFDQCNPNRGRIVYDSKLSNMEKPNLKNLEVEDYTSANDLGRTFVATVDTNRVKSEDQDKEGDLELQKHLILLNLDGVETWMNAHDAHVE